jgi:phosphatidylglycerol---prolipoprotein diacylglyceryl transferase
MTSPLVFRTRFEDTEPMHNVWVHNLDPFLVHISGSFGIRWYSLAYLCGFATGMIFMTWMARRKKIDLTETEASDFLTYMIVGVLLGGRLGYVFFYSPDLLTDFRSKFPYWGALAVWEGGMASHGGFIGVILGCIFFAWKNKKDPLHLGDLTIFGACFGFFFGRIANFINGELMGRVASADYPLAVKFPQDIYRWIDYDKSKLQQLTETVKLMGVNSTEWATWVANNYRGRMFDMADRIIDAIQGGNIAVTEAMGRILEPRHPSQLYGSLVEGLIPLIILSIVWLKPRKPGLICSLYLILYSLSRIVDEMFRLPDAHLSDLSQLPFGLTRGQFLSVWMFIFGLGLMIWTHKRKAPLYGGLLYQDKKKK